MKTEYKLKIENPCQKINWNDMTDIQKGKFCSVCTKNVLDFATWTDEEIIKFINNSDESMCARLNYSQLNRIVSINQQSGIKYWHKIIATLLLLTSTPSIYAIENKTEQINQHQTLKQEDKIKEVITKNPSPIDSTKNIIIGKLIEESSKEPIKGAIIEIEGTTIKAETDSSGSFQIVIPDNFLKDEIVLVVNAEYGFEGQTKITVFKNELPIKNLIIEKPSVLIGEVGYYKRKKWWQFWKRR